MKITVIGGTGKEGSGLALRWAGAGQEVIIGSRRLEKAQAAAARANEILGHDAVLGLDNVEAARQADLIVLSVPYQAHRTILDSVKEHLRGKILVDVTASVDPSDPSRVHLPEGGPAAVQAQELLGDDVRVVAAFQNISAHLLKDPHRSIDSDVLVCGDDAQAKEEVIRLAELAGMRGLDAGPLANAVAVESLTPVLIALNKRYRAKAAGIRITGLEEGR